MDASRSGEDLQRSRNGDARLFVTLSGLPLHFDLHWPVHPSTSGSDFRVLHGVAYVTDGSGLRAEFAANFSQVVWRALPSLEPQDAEPIVINAVRLAADSGMLEFLKTSKRQPVPISSRHYNVKTKTFSFAHASDAELRDFLERKIFWLGRERPVPVEDPYDVQYLGVRPGRLTQTALELSIEGLAEVEDDFAGATQPLVLQEPKFREILDRSLEHTVAKY
jgi:hypothetical protein